MNQIRFLALVFFLSLLAILPSSLSSLTEREIIFKICNDANWTYTLIINRTENSREIQNSCQNGELSNEWNHTIMQNEIITQGIRGLLCKNGKKNQQSITSPTKWCERIRSNDQNTTHYSILSDSGNIYVLSKLDFRDLYLPQNTKIKISVASRSKPFKELKTVKNVKNESTTELINESAVSRRKRQTSNMPSHNYQVTVLFAKYGLDGNIRIPIKLTKTTDYDYLHFILNGNFKWCKLETPTGEILDMLLPQNYEIGKPVDVADREGVKNYLATILPEHSDQVHFGGEDQNVWIIIADGNNYNITAMAIKKPAANYNYNNDAIATSLNSDDSNSKHYRRREIAEEGWRPIIPNPGEFRRKNENDVPPFENEAASNLLQPFISQQSIVIIEASSKTKLYAMPGEITSLLFDVTYYGPITILVHFHCNYQSAYPCEVEPKWVTLYPAKVMSVLVTVKAEGSEGSVSLVQLTAQAIVSWSQKAYLYIGKQISDHSKPDIDYEFSGNCEDADKGNTCHSKQWSVDITARDQVSGLLKVFSEPPALIFSTEFIAGMKEPVHGRYSASCCNTKVDITALDVAGNQYTKTLDVQHQTLSFLEWTVIILGVLILLLIVAITVYCIVKWRRKRRERELFRN